MRKKDFILQHYTHKLGEKAIYRNSISRQEAENRDIKKTLGKDIHIRCVVY